MVAVQLTVNEPPGAITFTPAVTEYVAEVGTGAGAGATTAGVGAAGKLAPQPTVMPRKAATIPVRMVLRPDGSRVELPSIRTRPGGYRFLPNGTGLVYLPLITSVDFWLVDFATKVQRQLTRLTSQDALGTFDITPDGKDIVFDRTRENSDIVLIELPK
jgi:hypothetical protein